MNNKVTLQDLADQLSAISGQSKKLSESFLRALTEIVEDALSKDGIAKVKGIGTFKIVAIEERKSVSVTDGSAVIIPAHKKITFTPEKELKEAVNKPYEDLETYVLPDDGPVDGPFIEEDDDEQDEPEALSNEAANNSTANYYTEPSSPVTATNVASEPIVAAETPQYGAANNSTTNYHTEPSSPVTATNVANEPVVAAETPQYGAANSSTINYHTEPSSPVTATNVASEPVVAAETPQYGAAKEGSVQSNTNISQPITEDAVAPTNSYTSVSETQTATETPTVAPAPEPGIESADKTTAETATQPATETCAPVGPTLTEDIQQTAEHTFQEEKAEEVVTEKVAPTSFTPQTENVTETPQETIKEIKEEVKEAIQSDNVEPIEPQTTEEKKEGQEETTPEASSKAQATNDTTYTTKESEGTKEEPVAKAGTSVTDATDANEGDKKGKHHKKKKKERNRSLLAVIIILALLIIACLVYALRDNKGFSNNINELKGKITGLFTNTPVQQNVDSIVPKDTISKEEQVDEFFEERLEDTYEAAQADQEFPEEVEIEQNWDWFEEGVKNFIKKEYPKLNFEVKGEPTMDTIRRGQTLTSMSRKHYNGVKDFWVYIYLYNKDVIRRPDDVSVGTPIKIPQLDESVIDPNSYMSINAAKDVKESYLRLFN
ncbi:MAG: HU family DNA-binding protein [Paludibacteraceae bacterium]|nr:HU family DNA-binding protein [Paludibacteraceae bacterium]